MFYTNKFWHLFANLDILNANRGLTNAILGNICTCQKLSLNFLRVGQKGEKEKNGEESLTLWERVHNF